MEYAYKNQSCPSFSGSMDSRQESHDNSLNKKDTSLSANEMENGIFRIYTENNLPTDALKVILVKETSHSACETNLSEKVLANRNFERNNSPTDSFGLNDLSVREDQVNSSERDVTLTNSFPLSARKLGCSSKGAKNRQSIGTTSVCERRPTTDLVIENIDAEYSLNDTRHSSRSNHDSIQIDMDPLCQSVVYKTNHTELLPLDSTVLGSSSCPLSVLPRGEELLSDSSAPPTYRSLIELIIEDSPPSYEAVTGKKVPYDEVITLFLFS